MYEPTWIKVSQLIRRSIVWAQNNEQESTADGLHHVTRTCSAGGWRLWRLDDLLAAWRLHDLDVSGELRQLTRWDHQPRALWGILDLNRDWLRRWCRRHRTAASGNAGRTSRRWWRRWCWNENNQSKQARTARRMFHSIVISYKVKSKFNCVWKYGDQWKHTISFIGA